MSLQHRLQELFDDHPDVKPAHLAAAIGKHRQSVADWLSGKAKTIQDANTANAVADFFQSNYNWLVRGMGEKYGNGNRGLSDNSNKLDEETLKEILKQGLENTAVGSMLSNTKERNPNPTQKEDAMSYSMMKKMEKLDTNIIFGISLLLSLDNVKDRNKQIIQAVEAISMGLDGSVNLDIKVKPVVHAEATAQGRVKENG